MKLAPLTKVLIKIFANGFYKAHSGLLLFLFSSIVIYYFFINVLNQTHLTPEERIRFNLSLVLAFVSNPIVMALVFTVWLIYTIKSWQYVGEQLRKAEQQFLFYSSTSFNKVRQFKSWFIVQLIILLPIISYGVFSLIIGLLYKHYVAPGIIVLYILLLATGNAFLIVWQINRLFEAPNQSILFQLFQKWPKPFFSLFFYHVLDKLKLSLVLTKLFSWISIIGILHFLSDVPLDLRVAGIVMLTVVLVHTILIYQEHSFQETYVRFARNLPYSRARLFLDFTLIYLLLLLPESIWLFSEFNFLPAFVLLIFSINTILLFRSLLFYFGLDMRQFLKWIAILLFCFYFTILYDFLWFLIPLNLVSSFILFYTNYYKE